MSQIFTETIEFQDTYLSKFCSDDYPENYYSNYQNIISFLTFLNTSNSTGVNRLGKYLTGPPGASEPSRAAPGKNCACAICDNPPPQFGGKECEGSPASFEKCEMPGCLRVWFVSELCCYTINSRKLNILKRSHLDGGWTGWSNLTSCNSICGMGMQRTLRTCTAPAPANGGRECTGESMLSRECDNGPCPS
ncbi:CADN-like protein, partial [Mya arenaria]